MSTPPSDDTPTDPTISRRGWGKHLLLSASALAVLFASNKPAAVQAAPPTDTWKLGGNTGVDSTNFIGPTNSAPLIIKTAGVERMRVTASGNVGIGNASPAARFMVDVSNGVAIYARHLATSGDAPAIRGDTAATVDNASAVYGIVTNRSPGVNSAGVRGDNNAVNSKGAGVRGNHAGNGAGVYGSSLGGNGVQGTSTNSHGVHGEGAFGVYGSGTNYGVYGAASTGIAVYATGKTGVVGVAVNNGVEGYGSNYGVYGHGATGVVGDAGTTGYGVSGIGKIGVSGGGTQYGVSADAGTTGYGVYAKGIYGVYGVATSTTNKAGVYGQGGMYGVQGGGGSTAGVQGNSPYMGVSADGGVYGIYARAINSTGTNYGVWGESSSGSGWAGYFNGSVNVIGTIVKGGGAFKIDHPLDPSNKYLMHSFVESPDMMNVYNGNVTLDAKGEATVTLPDWFEALNRDFRYQLTPIGAPAVVYISQTINGNQFGIAGGTAGMQVSWQVTGVRQDAYANTHRIPTEVQKPTAERGRYLHPDAFGKPSSMGVAAVHAPRIPQDTSAPQQHAPTDTMLPPTPDSVRP